MKNKKIITKNSQDFLVKYINNPSPTGFESKGQKIWLKYIKPYIDSHFVDTYGTVVGVINPEAETATGLVQIFWDVEYAADYLTFLKKKV
mgnify:CR=1 FL=1